MGHIMLFIPPLSRGMLTLFVAPWWPAQCGRLMTLVMALLCEGKCKWWEGGAGAEAGADGSGARCQHAVLGLLSGLFEVEY